MHKFIWQVEEKGQRIDDFLDMMCEYFPFIMKEVVKHGIGDLSAWFDGNSYDINFRTATCGCLVGTAAIAARETVECLVPVMDAELAHRSGMDRDYFEQSAVYSLYMAMVLTAKRDISKYKKPKDYLDLGGLDSSYFIINHEGFDPWLVTVARVGMDAADEATEFLLSEEFSDEEKQAFGAAPGEDFVWADDRNQHVVDYMHERIVANLILQGVVKPRATLDKTIAAIRAM